MKEYWLESIIKITKHQDVILIIGYPDVQYKQPTDQTIGEGFVFLKRPETLLGLRLNLVTAVMQCNNCDNAMWQSSSSVSEVCHNCHNCVLTYLLTIVWRRLIELSISGSPAWKELHKSLPELSQRSCDIACRKGLSYQLCVNLQRNITSTKAHDAPILGYPRSSGVQGQGELKESPSSMKVPYCYTPFMQIPYCYIPFVDFVESMQTEIWVWYVLQVWIYVLASFQIDQSCKLDLGKIVLQNGKSWW